MKKYIYGLIGREVSRITRYCDSLTYYPAEKRDNDFLFASIEASFSTIVQRVGEIEDFKKDPNKRGFVLINGLFNYTFDIQGILNALKERLSRSTRVGVISYNPYLRWIYSLLNLLRLREGDPPLCFITKVNLENLARLCGYEIHSMRTIGYFPFRLYGLGTIINKVLPTIPFFRMFSYVTLHIFRPIIPEEGKPSISIIIPARNEEGNIENALKRIPSFEGAPLEIIFIEGHSTDKTWEAIQHVSKVYEDKFVIKIAKQVGEGKGDAVRLGFSMAKNDLLTILDADLTMPPERLNRFYEAYCRGLGDFINGNRLIYPMENAAMRFINRLGNILYAKLLSFVLDLPIGDSLCGTKLFSRRDYERFCSWRLDFGDFDPFGDYELLFPASQLALGVIDLPIRYRDRTYGRTNIRRFYHGLQLLKMILIGFYRIKLGQG